MLTLNRKTFGILLMLLVLIVSLEMSAFARVPTSDTQPAISEIDRTRLAEAFRLGDQIGDQVWPEWHKAPFAVLLVTPDYEFLLRHPQPSPDFTKLGYDTLLKSDVYFRKRSFSTGFLATFPAIAGSMTSTIVVGQAENTWVKTSTPWVVTLLHEHFHQLQDSQPNFYTDVAALGLAHGDQTGMWMLNYAFPYDRKDVQDQFASMSKLLSEAVRGDDLGQGAKVHAFFEARQKFQAMLTPDDYKYISFQFWKEGIARYTEFHIALLAGTKFRPCKEFVALKDYRAFADVAHTTYEGIFTQLETQQLGVSKREVVYSYGAAEGLLLDKLEPRWRERYLQEKFDLGKLLPKTAAVVKYTVR